MISTLATVSPSPDVVGLLTDIRQFVTEAQEEGVNGFWCAALTDRIDTALNRIDATEGADHG